jgi:hypothetical protein
LLRDRLREEADFHGDLAFVSSPDTYARLTHKTLALLHWSLEKSGVSFKFLVKTDDDTFLRTDRLARLLWRTSRDNVGLPPLYWGFFNLGAVPRRSATEKWHDPIFPGDLYPPYALGSCYALESSLVRQLVDRDRAVGLPLFPMEDVSVGVWLNELNHTRLEALWDTFPFIRADDLSPEQVGRCEETMIVRSHLHGVAEQYRLAGNYLQCGRMCSCCSEEQVAKERRHARYEYRKKNADFFRRKREERRAKEVALYGSLKPSLAANVIQDPPDHNHSHALLLHQLVAND